ncbi:MAG: hypothetical protein LBP39_01510 [Rickettsiales bacterium]|jgi:uncharacterized protein YdeI (YjbR/CyaY-like superfamily)|nr:hypothetical protein [Rickettsiales bacterium]
MIQDTLYFENRQQWRSWLYDNCVTSKGIWLIFYRKSYRSSSGGSLTYSDARDEALCFGWIDSFVKNIDEERIKQYFSLRRPNGVWSKFNRDIIQKLIEQNLMTTFGLDAIEKAKANGSYYTLDAVENLVIPKELAEIFTLHREIEDAYNRLTRSKKKRIIYSLFMLKTDAAKKRKALDLTQNLL